MKDTVVDRDLGWAEIKREIEAMARQPHVVVGLQEGEDNHSAEGISTAGIGAVHEFGSRDGRIPERSWLRSSFDDNRAGYQRLIDKLVSAIYQGKVKALGALHIVGQKVEADAKKRIVELRTPPNAEITVARKGSSNPLVDTGTMLNSVRYKVEDQS